jgi:hypothetical protein
MNNILYLGIDIQFARLNDTDHKRGLTFLSQYDLPYTDLNTYDGLIISTHIDEYFMAEHDDQLQAYLNNGGVIFSLAEKGMDWLQQVPDWKRSPLPLKDREVHIKKTDHGFLENIQPKHLEYRKGVRGFFSRGYFETVPKAAEVLITDQNNDVIMYVDRASTNGTIYAGAGTDLYRIYADEDNSANQAGLQMLKAIRKEAALIKGRVKS